MHRVVFAVAAAAALLSALAVGPFGAAAGAPYVYGCTPAAFSAQSSGDVDVRLDIYDGSAGTANLTTKILGQSGRILNNTDGTYYLLPLTMTIAATYTYDTVWAVPGYSASGLHVFSYTVRIVSNVPVAATLTHLFSADTSNVVAIHCSPIQP